jgi:nicotinamidase/pyrazinamidase
MTALLLVDLQNDFFPGGALAVKEGDQVLPIVNELIKMPFDLIIATKDYHPPMHISFATTHGKKVGDKIKHHGVEQVLWPDHCVQGTKGSEFAFKFPDSLINEIVFKGTLIDVDSYSTFYDNDHKSTTGLETLLKKKGIQTLYVTGLATDYCVKYSVLDAIALGFSVYVVKEGCRAVNLNADDEDKAYDEMEKMGAKLISIKELRERGI